MSATLAIYLFIQALPTPLVEADGVIFVKAHCTSCHSESLITQNRGTRADWTKTIRWMQETQNLWAIPSEDEAKILDYLAANYGPKVSFRRAALATHLMPPPRKAKSGDGLVDRRESVPTPSAALGPSCSCASAHSTTAGTNHFILIILLISWRLIWRKMTCFRLNEAVSQ